MFAQLPSKGAGLMANRAVQSPISNVERAAAISRVKAQHGFEQGKKFIGPEQMGNNKFTPSLEQLRRQQTLMASGNMF